MQEDMDLEQSEDGRRARLQQKIEAQIERIGVIIDELLAGVAMSELTSKDRIFAVARFMDLYQHAIAIDNQLEDNRVENRSSNAISAVLRKLREEREREGFRVIEAEIIPYPEFEDSDLEDEQTCER